MSAASGKGGSPWWRRPGLRLLVGVGLLVVLTVATAAFPALRFAAVLPELRVAVEVAEACASLFAAVALALPGDEDADPARDAFVIALGLLGLSDAAFAVAPVLTGGGAQGLLGPAFYPWLAARWAAGLLFVQASLGRPAAFRRGYLLLIGGGGVVVALSLFLLAPGGPSSSTAAALQGAAAAPGLLFALGAWLAWRAFARGASSVYLWLSAALAVQACAQAHELLYPAAALLGPVVTTADALRALVLVLLLCGALLELQRLYEDRLAVVLAQDSDLRVQEELLRVNREFLDREEDFRSIVAHELATPLAALRVFAHVLDDQVGVQASPAARTALAGIDGESRRLQELIARVEELRGLERDDFRCELRPVHVRPLLEDAARFVAGLPGGHTVTVEAEGDERVLADPVRLGQALRNVLANAARYAPRGSPIRVLGRQLAVDGRYEIAVVDAGPGVPESERERVLDKYARGGAGRAAAEGVGLGLYVASRIARAHGGEMTVTDAQVPDGAGPRGARVALTVEQAR